MGHTAMKLSPIGFGAFKIGRNRGIKYPRSYDLPDEALVDRLLNGVLDLGIRYIDTAPAYGVSEERIGRAIGHRRDEFVLSTKVGETFGDDGSQFDFSERGVRTSVERSLRRLRTEVLDFVFVHANRDDVSVLKNTDVVETLHSLRESGVVRWIGFSGYTERGFEASLFWADAIMATYHPEDPSLESVIAAAAGRGVTVVVKKPLASGHLDAAEAIRFVLSNRSVTSAVVGGLNLDHMRENHRIACDVRGGDVGSRYD